MQKYFLPTLLLVLAAVLLQPYSYAQEPIVTGQPATLSFFGMNTYFTGLERINRDGDAGVATLISRGRELGAGWAREELSWGNLERTAKGEWQWSLFDQKLLATARAGYGIVGMLLTTPGWARVNTCEERRLRYAAQGVRADNFWCPPENMQDYADYVRAVVERYDADGLDDAPGSPRVAVWQIWNEPNAWETWPGSPAEYGLLLQAGYNAVKAADPTAIVATAGLYVLDGGWNDGIGHSDGLRFLDEALAAVPAAWNSFDALAIHPYMPDVAPDQPGIYGAVTYWGRLALARNWLAERTASRGGPLRPLWISEVGWSTCSAEQSDCYALQSAYQLGTQRYNRALTPLEAPSATLQSLIGKTEQQQAEYMVRAHAIALALGVQHLNYFQLEDKFDGSANNFWEEASLLRTGAGGYARKPAATAYAAMVNTLGNAGFVGFGPLHSFAHNPTAANLVARYHLRFATPTGQQIDLIWHNAGSELVGMPLDPNRNATLVNLYGASAAIAPTAGAITFEVSEAPLYIVQNWQPGTRFMYLPFVGRTAP
jgi:hypothetical protein